MVSCKERLREFQGQTEYCSFWIVRGEPFGFAQNRLAEGHCKAKASSVRRVNSAIELDWVGPFFVALESQPESQAVDLNVSGLPPKQR